MGVRRQAQVSFAADGKVSAQIVCNRGSGAWKSEGPGQVNFGPMAVTTMACMKSGDVDRFGRDWINVRSYVIRDGHLFLSLVAEGDTYEFEPVR